MKTYEFRAFVCYTGKSPIEAEFKIREALQFLAEHYRVEVSLNDGEPIEVEASE